jgi:hypothetical protein
MSWWREARWVRRGTSLRPSSRENRPDQHHDSAPAADSALAASGASISSPEADLLATVSGPLPSLGSQLAPRHARLPATLDPAGPGGKESGSQDSVSRLSSSGEIQCTSRRNLSACDSPRGNYNCRLATTSPSRRFASTMHASASFRTPSCAHESR